VTYLLFVLPLLLARHESTSSSRKPLPKNTHGGGSSRRIFRDGVVPSCNTKNVLRPPELSEVPSSTVGFLDVGRHPWGACILPAPAFTRPDRVIGSSEHCSREKNCRTAPLPKRRWHIRRYKPSCEAQSRGLHIRRSTRQVAGLFVDMHVDMLRILARFATCHVRCARWLLCDR
jgi:hypothetical protein